MLVAANQNAGSGRSVALLFVAWKRGDLHGLAVQAQQAGDVFAASAERTGLSAAILGNIRTMDDLAEQVTHLPIWSGGKRPLWWHDLEVREFLTRGHRQTTTLKTAAEGRVRFGSRCPAKTAINEFWQKLDRVFGLLPQRPRNVRQLLADQASLPPSIPRPSDQKDVL
jgi:hypothetical protein